MKRRTDHNRNPFVVITDYFRNQFIYCVDFNKRLKQRAADLDLLWSPLTRSLWCSTGRAVTHAASNSCVRLSTLTHSSTHKYNLTMNQERCESACLGLLQDKAMDTKLPKSPAGSQRSAQPCNALSALWQQICTQSYPLYAHTYCIHPGLQIQFAFSHLTNAPHARTNKSAGAVWRWHTHYRVLFESYYTTLVICPISLLSGLILYLTTRRQICLRLMVDSFRFSAMCNINVCT